MDAEIDILLVEDNPDDAELTLRALRKGGVTERLLHVDDGAKALEALFPGGRVRTPLPRFILLDLKLPKVAGLEVLKRVKGDERTAAIPVVVLTSSKEERDIAESYRLGANSYIVKPVNFDQYMACVSQVGAYWASLNQLPQPPA